MEDGEREWVWRDDVRLNFKQPPSEAILFSGIASLPTFDSELDLGSKSIMGIGRPRRTVRLLLFAKESEI